MTNKIQFHQKNKVLNRQEYQLSVILVYLNIYYFPFVILNTQCICFL